MKQVIVTRADLDMGRGKFAAQTAYASLLAYKNTDSQTWKRWEGGGQKKAVLKVNDEPKPFELADEAERAGIPHAITCNVGYMQFDLGTVTALTVGPAKNGEINRVTGDLLPY